MDRARMDVDLESHRARNAFVASRQRVVARLTTAGIAPSVGEPLVDEWLRSTEMLPDFVAAPDYWQLAYRFALEEYRRRGIDRLARGRHAG